MKHAKLVAATVVSTLTLAGCESPQETAARQAQFNGQTVDSVIARIGQPRHHSANQAIWHFSEKSVNYVPIYTYNQSGQASVAGHRRQNVTSTCTYTATLSAGRVVQSDYVGNACLRFAPKLK